MVRLWWGYGQGHGGTVRSTAASQQEGRGFKSRMVQHVGACSRAFLCGVCMFSPCYPGSPRRTPTIKTCKKSRCSSVLTLTKSGPSTWTWSPGAASLVAHCSWMSLGEDSRMGKSREHLPPSCMCMCVCVLCCVAIKRACPPDVLQVMVRLWSGDGQVMVGLSSGYGEVMVRLWSGYGQVMVRLWWGVICWVWLEDMFGGGWMLDG